AVVNTVMIPGKTVRGAPFPPFDILPNEERNEQPVGRVPNGPLRGNLRPTLDGVNAVLAPQTASGAGVATNAVTDPVVFARSTAYGNRVTFAGSPPDMSGAANRNVVFTTGNTWAALSTNGGNNFNSINPTAVFPSGPSRDGSGNLIDGGLCC